MTEQIKAWAVVDNQGQPIGTYYEKTDLEDELVEYNRIGINPPYKIIELTSTPKIKMTQAQFDEFRKLKMHNQTLRSALETVFENYNYDYAYPNLSNLLYQGGHVDRNQSQLEFAQLWASDNPEELVEIKKETRYLLVSKLDSDMFVEKNSDESFRFGVKPLVSSKFTDAEIEELGGDDWLAEMGIKRWK